MDFAQLTFAPGAYKGTYSLVPYGGAVETGPFRGRAQAFVPAGRYYLYISHGVNFVFSVRQTTAGFEIVAESKGLVVHGLELRFATVPVRIDAGEYPGAFEIVGAEDPAKGSRTLDLPLDIVSADADAGYIVALAPGTSFRFNVASDGTVSLNSHHQGAADCRGNTLTLRTVTISVEPLNYTKTWQVVGAVEKPRTGAAPVILVPRVIGYDLVLYRSGLKCRFDIGINGKPSRDEVCIADGADTWRFRLRHVT